MKILFLEDDVMLQEIVKEHLEGLGHHVCAVSDGLDAEELAMSNKYDLWLFDINVPSQDGLTLLKGLRGVNSATPAIFITAQTQSDTILKAYENGVDDYLKKPFDLVELDARIGYIQKKLGLDSEILNLGHNASFRPKERSLFIGNDKYTLSNKEVLLLQFLATHARQVHSHEALCSVVWEQEEVPTDNTLRTYIKKLRQILGKEAIQTVHGLGYRFEY